jgi:hypothetical protein
MPDLDARSTTTHPDGFRIRDLVGLVVGYGLAGFLLRSFLAVIDPRGITESVELGTFYLWLGLAVSGPFVLLLDGRGPAPPPPVPTTDPPSRYAPEELIWLGIGGYFLFIALVVVPALDRGVTWLVARAIWDSTASGQALIGLGLAVCWTLGRRRARATPPGWTRRAARLVLVTWPVAWLVLVLLVR